MALVIGFAGYSNSGKTTVVSQLIKILSGRGYKVAAIKHAAHGYDIDIPGKDSWTHYQAGASRVTVIGPGVMTTHQRIEKPPVLKELLEEMQDIDILLIEGFKGESGKKILVYRPESSGEGLYPKGEYLAVVGDYDLIPAIPRFEFAQMESLADFIIQQNEK